jgi:hypothetical protein
VAALICLLMLVLCGGYLVVLLVPIVVGIGLLILRLKSWEEDVRLVFWSCAQHADELQPPDMAIDDQQLCVVSPTLELAAVAREAIWAKRKRGNRPSDEAAEAPQPSRPKRSRQSSSMASETPAPPQPQPVELPPIKLAGEEDEPPA